MAGSAYRKRKICSEIHGVVWLDAWYYRDVGVCMACKAKAVLELLISVSCVAVYTPGNTEGSAVTILTGLVCVWTV